MLKAALINGSPKFEDSNSQHLLDELICELQEECVMQEIPMRAQGIEDPEALMGYNVWVFAFPLYTDGIPSHLLRCLMQMEHYIHREPTDITVYVMVQCGFYEAAQTKLAMEMMENWCARCDLKWGQSIGIGGGGMLNMLDQKHNFCMLDVEEAMGDLAEMILKRGNAPTEYIEPNLPKKMYQVAAEMKFAKEGKANGLTKEAMGLK